MTINLQRPEITELKPRITVFGVGGGGGNAVNNMISGGLEGVEFVVANTDSQALHTSKAERVIQMGVQVTQGLGAGSQPQIGAQAAEECIDEIKDHLSGAHMAFVTAGMGGGTGTGAAPVVARAAREMGILTVGVVTKPFSFEGGRRMKLADAGIEELQSAVDTLIVIPNQNLFHVADEKTTLAEAFAMADQVLYEGVACITDLMVKEGLINLDFADVRSVMQEMGKAMMGTGEASGDKRALNAAEAAIANPLLDETNMAGAQGLLISITGGRDMTLFELDEAATRIREEVDTEANIIMGATFDDSLQGIIRVSVVATGIDTVAGASNAGNEARMREKAERMRSEAQARTQPAPQPSVQPSVQPAVAAVSASAPQAPQPAAQHAPVQQAPVQQAPAQHVSAQQAPQQQARPAAQPATQQTQQLGPRATSPAAAPQPARSVPAAAPVRPAASFSDEEFNREFESSLGAAPRPAGRMPRAEDFPAHARGEIAGEQAGERGAPSFLSKLTRAVSGSHGHAPAHQRMEPRVSGMEEERSAYAPQRGQAPLDQHGRPVTAHPVAQPAQPSAGGAPGARPRVEDDLEIPAFLRKSGT